MCVIGVSSGAQHQAHQQQQHPGSTYADPSPYSYTQHSHEHPASRNTPSPHLNASSIAGNSSNNTPYLFPTQARSRSKSDTSAEPPNWDSYPPSNQHQRQHHPQSMNMDGSALDDGVNMNDILPSHQHSQLQGQVQYQQSYNQHAQQQQPQMTQGFSFGPPSSQQTHTQGNNFLTPDANLRRTKSDAMGRGHHRQSRSEDIRTPVAGNSGGAAFLFPPSSHADSYGLGAGNSIPQFLSADPLPSIRSGGGHYRRASSGTRSERGSGASRDFTIGMRGDGNAGGPGAWSGASSQRPSPYPSPNASPRPRYEELSGPGPLPMPGMSGMGPGMPGSESRGTLTAAEPPVNVSKPNVTTGRTANASHKRRKQEATFMCPVPGCGSTFTRSFNLKGRFDIFGFLVLD